MQGGSDVSVITEIHGAIVTLAWSATAVPSHMCDPSGDSEPGIHPSLVSGFVGFLQQG